MKAEPDVSVQARKEAGPTNMRFARAAAHAIQGFGHLPNQNVTSSMLGATTTSFAFPFSTALAVSLQQGDTWPDASITAHACCGVQQAFRRMTPVCEYCLSCCLHLHWSF